MKKLLNSLLLTILLLIPMIVKADMGAPSVPKYELKVINKDGAILYIDEDNFKETGKLEYGTTFYGEWEWEHNGETYIFVSIDGQEGYVRLKDLAPVKQSVSPEELQSYKLERPIKVRVYANEAVLRTGPGELFDEIARIKKDTIGTAIYMNANFYYVELNGQKGWVDALGNTMLYYSDILYITKFERKTNCGTIPANTVFSGGWESNKWDSVNFFDNSEDGGTLVEYNNCETFISTFKDSETVGLSKTYYHFVYTNKTIKIYEDTTYSKLVSTIPAGKMITIFGSPMDTYDFYVFYDGIKGWYKYPDNDDIEFIYEGDPHYDKNTANKLEKEVEEYLDSLEDGTAPEPISPETTPEEPTKKPVEPNNKAGMNSKDILIACCIGACAFALGAVASIILVNRKKDKKVEETPTPENNETNKE